MVFLVSSPPVRGEIHSWPPGNVYTLQTQDIMLSTGNLLLLWQSFHFFSSGNIFSEICKYLSFSSRTIAKKKTRTFFFAFLSGLGISSFALFALFVKTNTEEKSLKNLTFLYFKLLKKLKKTFPSWRRLQKRFFYLLAHVR